MKDLQKALRSEIHQQLKRVNRLNVPHVYQLIQTASGYKNVEERIITMVATDGITPSACIPNIENELIF